MENSIEIVLVLYQCSLRESIAFTTLEEQLRKNSIDYELMIYNNDKNQKIEHEKYVVINSEKNQKLSKAYNFALERAIKNRRKWLLLLDQDTFIPDNYFVELEKLFASNYSPDLVAIVPFLETDGKILSPKKISPYMRFDSNVNKAGYTRERINAFNSMSLLRADFMKLIGGFSNQFPLDMLDHWIYHQIYQHRKWVYILPVFVKHDSSFIKLEENVSISRYKEFLIAESTFILKNLGLVKFFFYKLKLIFRSIKQAILLKNKKFALTTFKWVFKL
jgi:hypothetical protein